MPCHCPACVAARPVGRQFRAIVEAAHVAAARGLDSYTFHRANVARTGSDRYSAQRIREWCQIHTQVVLCDNCFTDRDTCGCWMCEGCNEMHTARDRRCHRCQHCDDCCECAYCEGCDQRVESLCPDCDRCTDCCECHIRARGIPFWEPRERKFHGDPSARYPRHVGIEIECGTDGDYDTLRRALEKWSAACHDDGSINLGNSAEIATAPARGDKFEQQIMDICLGLAACGAKVDTSCGLHCHVNVKDFTAKQILAAVRLYSRVEPALYAMVAPSRRNGQYSKAWGDHFEISDVFEHGSVEERAQRLDASLYGSVNEAEEMKRSPYKHGCRYHGLNLNAILLYGTIEFRLHHGTVDATKIKMWAAICSALVEYAATHTEKEIAKLPGSSSEILHTVLKGDPEVARYAKARRAHFTNQIRKSRGLDPVTVRNAPMLARESGES